MWGLDHVISGEFTIVLLFHTRWPLGSLSQDERVVYYVEATLLIVH